jgi:GTP-binding protein Era
MQNPLRSGFAAVLGKTNVGKSTLLNALVGAKVSIVTDKPQTTRHRIVGIVNRDWAQLVLIDTPGIHQPKHPLDEALLAAATRSLPDAELCLLVADVSTSPSPEDEQGARLVRDSGIPTVLALNKCDRVLPEVVEARAVQYGELAQPVAAHRISALTGAGLDGLVDDLLSRLPEGPHYYPADSTTDQLEDFLVAERIRECVMDSLHQEVPYSVAVTVDELEPRDNGKLYIHANLYVERESQKRILIGQGGQTLKSIGAAARAQLEPIFGQSVFLDLWVRVLPKWRKNENSLRRLGYIGSD